MGLRWVGFAEGVLDVSFEDGVSGEEGGCGFDFREYPPLLIVLTK
jgi:hypothetical protein